MKVVNHVRVPVCNVFDAVSQLNVREVAVDLVIADSPCACHAGNTAGSEREIQWERNEEEGNAANGNLCVPIGFQVVQRNHLVRPHPNP